MAIYNVPNYKTADGFGMSLNIRRGNPNPLDNSSVWSSYDAALNYAKTDAVAYVGQLLAVVNPAQDGQQHTVDVYKIELDVNGVGTLVKVGAEEAQAAVDQLKTQVDGLVSDLEAAQQDITEIDGKVVALTTTSEDHETRISSLESKDFATKTDVSTAKDEAIAAAKTETTNQIGAVVSQYLTGEGAADTIDTLNEIAQWIVDDQAGAAKIIADVKTIQDDYLKGADKTELNKAISDLSTYVGTIPEGATSSTVVAYVKEVVDALNIGDYAKAADLTALAGRVTTLEGKEIAVADVTGLPEALSGKVDTKSTEYKGAEVPWTLLSPENQDKLSKLILNSDGTVETGTKVAAGDVEGLATWITQNASSVEGLSENNLTDELVTKIQGAIQEVAVNGTTIAPVDGKVDLPLATSTAYGVVKLGSEFTNTEDGALSVVSINVNKLTQTKGEFLELNGGTAADFEN